MRFEIWHPLREEVDLSLVKMMAVEAVAGKIRRTAEADIGAVGHVVPAVIEKKLGNEMRCVATNLDNLVEKKDNRFPPRKGIGSVNNVNSRVLQATEMVAENGDLVVVNGVIGILISTKNANLVVVTLEVLMVAVDHLHRRQGRTPTDRIKAEEDP
jgi:hypothetical protein